MFAADEMPPWLRRALGQVIRRTTEWSRKVADIGPDTDVAKRFAAFGEGSCLGWPTGAVYNERWISVGHHTMIGPYTTLSAGMGPGQDLGERPVVRIGDRCSIGRSSYIVGHASLDIGDHVYTGPNVYITDQNHIYADPNLPIGRQWPANNRVSIGSGSWLGFGAVVLPGSVLGPNVAVAACSVVRGEFPGHCVLAGAPARVVRRLDEDGNWDPPLRVPAPEIPPEWVDAVREAEAALLARPYRPEDGNEPAPL
ncbi:MAG TPA: acyltransferase [Acidimicrobiales bacterium]|jgi:serine acetyltransferase|nr:acyltransferase [Acidimicrobiales bacterium]